MTPETLAQRQLDAYNARDLAAFIACYSDDVKVYRLPSATPVMSGKAQLADYYATQRFNLPALHAEVVNRMVLGNKVIDHERVKGVREQPFEVAAIYEVAEGLIQTVWFVSAD